MGNKKNKGFTILELLVVIAIASMILSFTMISIREIKAKSRDSRREEDIKQIQNALSIYITNRRTYPVCALEVVIGGAADACIGPILISENAFQSGQTPRDPLNGVSGACGAADNYAYCYQSDGFTYNLRYALETDSISGKTSGWQNPISP